MFHETYTSNRFAEKLHAWCAAKEWLNFKIQLLLSMWILRWIIGTMTCFSKRACIIIQTIWSGTRWMAARSVQVNWNYNFPPAIKMTSTMLAYKRSVDTVGPRSDYSSARREFRAARMTKPSERFATSLLCVKRIERVLLPGLQFKGNNKHYLQCRNSISNVPSNEAQ